MKAIKNEVYTSFVRTLNVPEWSLPYLLGDTPWEARKSYHKHLF